MVDEELVWAAKVRPDLLGGGVFVKPGQMAWDACMQTAYNFVEHGFFFTHVFVRVSSWTWETVFFVDHLPDGWTIVVGEGFDVCVEIEIFALVIFLILDVPNPGQVSGVSFLLLSFLFPDVDTPLDLLLDFIRFLFDPVCGDVLIIASTNGTAFWLAYFVSGPEVAFAVEIGSECTEVFGFYK